MANGYDSDWMPGGYRDVKINPVVNEHLCEIQLHLREFFALKRGQHEVYVWARDLPVRTEMAANHLFKSLSPEVVNDMISLARQNWSGTGYYLPELLVAAGKYDEAEESLRQVVRFEKYSRWLALFAHHVHRYVMCLMYVASLQWIHVRPLYLVYGACVSNVY